MNEPIYDGDPTKAVRWWSGAGEPPRIAVWEITLQCDHGCRHCGSRAGAQRSDELSTAEALDVVEQLAKLGVRETILIGGEAYLRDDWVDIANAVTQSGMTCSMVTGGLGFDAFHLEEALAAGVKHIGVSIDGIGETHDALRGVSGSFEAAVATVRRIGETGEIGLSVNSQINRLSMPELTALARLLVEIEVPAWQLQLTVALGRAADRPHLLLQPYHMRSLIPMLAEIKSTILDPGHTQLIPGNNIGYFGGFEEHLRYGGDRGYVWSGCGAGKAAIGLEADGTVKGCPSLPRRTYTAGNVRDTTIEQVWKSWHGHGALGPRTPSDLSGFCATCEHNTKCLGGCTWTAHALFGHPGNNPYCFHRAQSLAQQGMCERIQLVENAPGEPFDHGRYDLILEPLVDAEPANHDYVLDIVTLGTVAHQLRVTSEAGSLWPQETLRALTRKSLPVHKLEKAGS